METYRDISLSMFLQQTLAEAYRSINKTNDGGRNADIVGVPAIRGAGETVIVSCKILAKEWLREHMSEVVSWHWM